LTVTTGYSGTPLAKKLGIKAGHHISLIGEPDEYFGLFKDLPQNINWHKNFDTPDLDMIHIFIVNKEFYMEVLPQAKKAIKKNGSIWVSWPKRTSDIPTDVSENIIRSVGLSVGLVDVKVCAINGDWSGLKFVYRLKDR